jgi:flavin reductase (DIM6/NTAB) family NADH-FMN oxidoreductase RutF
MRAPVSLPHAYKLLNHGPTVLVSAASNGQQNVMAAAWAMPLDFDPPKLAVVIAQDTFTRRLIEASQELCLSVPTNEQLELTWAVGSTSGREIDKQERFEVIYEQASLISAPLIGGCAAWLECKLYQEPSMQERYDLFIAEVVAAWADDQMFQHNTWNFEVRQTIHHLNHGTFFATGAKLQAKKIF